MKIQKSITIYFTAWLITVTFILFFSYFSISHGTKEKFVQSLENWDGRHYLNIAKDGYTQNFQYAFFPLFPLIVRIMTGITHNFLVSAILISLLSSFLAINIFYNLMRIEFKKAVAEKGVFFLLFFPTSFYLLMSYSEGLFILFVMLSFYYLRKKKILFSVIFASLASATRLAGLAVVLALMVDILSNHSLHRKKWLILIAPTGFLSYCLYLFSKTGDPFYFLTSQLHWMRSLAIPGLNIWETLRVVSFPGLLLKYPNMAIDLIFTIFLIGMVLRSFRFLPFSYGVYGLISLLLPLTTPTLMSMPRFILPIFPIFILLAKINNQYFIFIYQLVSIMLLSAFAVMYINGYWVS